MTYIIMCNSKENYNNIIMEGLDAFHIKVREDYDILLLLLISLRGLGNYMSTGSPRW